MAVFNKIPLNINEKQLKSAFEPTGNSYRTYIFSNPGQAAFISMESLTLSFGFKI